MNIYITLAMAAAIGFQQAPFLPLIGGITGAVASESISLSNEQVYEKATEAPEAIAKAPATEVSHTLTVELSAYTSTPEETDDTPFITASGSRTRHGIVATNILPFGTKIQIPEYYGDEVFVVEDRMNRRYQENVDIWMAEKGPALKFGRREGTIVVLK